MLRRVDRLPAPLRRKVCDKEADVGEVPRRRAASMGIRLIVAIEKVAFAQDLQLFVGNLV